MYKSGLIQFNEYFGTNRFAGCGYYGGNYSTNSDSYFTIPWPPASNH